MPWGVGFPAEDLMVAASFAEDLSKEKHMRCCPAGKR